MKTTKDSIAASLWIALLVAAFIVIFYLQFKPVYGHCHMEGADRVCDLLGYVKR